MRAPRGRGRAVVAAAAAGLDWDPGRHAGRPGVRGCQEGHSEPGVARAQPRGTLRGRAGGGSQQRTQLTRPRVQRTEHSQGSRSRGGSGWGALAERARGALNPSRIPWGGDIGPEGPCYC